MKISPPTQEYHDIISKLAKFIDRYIIWKKAPVGDKNAPRFMENLKVVITRTFEELERMLTNVHIQ